MPSGRASLALVAPFASTLLLLGSSCGPARPGPASVPAPAGSPASSPPALPSVTGSPPAGRASPGPVATPVVVDGVTLTTDRPIYSTADTVVVTMANHGTGSVTPIGGVVCGPPWPLRLQRTDGVTWRDVHLPTNGKCVGVTVALVPPGASHTFQEPAGPNPGTYRYEYPFTPTDQQHQPGTLSAATAPFVVRAP